MPTVTRLPEATRSAQMSLHGLRPDCVGSRIDLEDGHDLANDVPMLRTIQRPASRDTARHTLREGGWSVATPGGELNGGLVAHRGVLHPDEYVDMAVVRDAVCGRLGFTAVEIRSVYRQGPMTPEARALRDRIDARLLELAEAGGVMIHLARALGWAMRPNGTCKTLENALSRARARRVVAA